MSWNAEGWVQALTSTSSVSPRPSRSVVVAAAAAAAAAAAGGTVGAAEAMGGMGAVGAVGAGALGALGGGAAGGGVAVEPINPPVAAAAPTCRERCRLLEKSVIMS